MNFRAGVTRADLLSSLAVVTLFGFLALPALGKARGVRATAICLSNMRDLTRAWELYAQDNSGALVQNYTGGDSLYPPPGRAMWAAGWMDWSSSRQNTNMALIREERYSKLAPYFQSDDQNIHKCTLDRFLSRQQLNLRFKERVRSVAMNGTVGDGNAQMGPWESIYAQARRQNELIHPGPERTSVFLEEHPDSINDPVLYPPQQNQWIDLPSGLHANGGVAGFADGHAELHLWRRSLRNRRVRYSFFSPLAQRGDPDIVWMSYHSNRRTERSH